MQRLLLVLLALACFASAPCPSRADDGAICEMPDDLVSPSEKLPHVATALKRTDTLSLLALGSGSTVGDSSGVGGPALAYHAPGGSYPYRMQAALQTIRPSLHVELTVKGGRNMTAEDMLGILTQEIAVHHYDLVLWQTGTVEAVRGLRPDVLRSVLQQGVDMAAKAGADLILIDPQFSRFLRANADLSPYEAVMQQMAGNTGISLFRRFDLTQTWASSGQVDLERVGRDQRDKTIGLLNSCLGIALARYVLNGATEP